MNSFLLDSIQFNFLLCPLGTLALPTLGTFVGNASVPNGEHCFTDSHDAFVVSEVCARDEEILSDDFGNGGRALVSDDDNDEEQEVDVETADEKRLRIAKAYIDRTRQAELMPWCADACPFFSVLIFSFPLCFEEVLHARFISPRMPIC